MNSLPLVDAHLDLAENVTLFGRDLTMCAAEIRTAEQRTASQATVSLPDLERGGIAVVCATVTPGFLAADVGDNTLPKSGHEVIPHPGADCQNHGDQHGRAEILVQHGRA